MKFIQNECIVCDAKSSKKHDVFQCLKCGRNYKLQGKHNYSTIKYIILSVIILAAGIFTYLYQTSDQDGLFIKYRYLKFGVSIGLLAPMLYGIMELFKKFRNSKSFYCVTTLNEKELEAKSKKSLTIFGGQIVLLILTSYFFTKYMVIPYFRLAQLINDSTFYNQ